jgi:hypothetical protein
MFGGVCECACEMNCNLFGKDIFPQPGCLSFQATSATGRDTYRAKAPRSVQGARRRGMLSLPNSRLLDWTGVLHRHVHQALLGSGADNPLSD